MIDKTKAKMSSFLWPETNNSKSPYDPHVGKFM